MTAVLPPLGGATPRGGTGALRLSQLPLRQVDDAIADMKQQVLDLKHAHVMNEERRQQALVPEQQKEIRREARQERMKIKHACATKIQALVRSYFARRFVLPSVQEAKAALELKKSRIALTEAMLGLHQNIHDLAYPEMDRCTAATHIQAWWRAVFAKRVVAIIRFRHHLCRVSSIMAKASTKISAIARGRQARMGCFRLRREKEKRQLKAKRVQIDREIQAVILIQSHVRRRMAIAATKGRRADFAKELDGDTRTASPAGVDSSRKKETERSRRKRTASDFLSSSAGESGGGKKVASPNDYSSSPPQEATPTVVVGSLAAADDRKSLLVHDQSKKFFKSISVDLKASKSSSKKATKFNSAD